MNILKRSTSLVPQSRRTRREATSGSRNYSSVAASRDLAIARRRREYVLAWLALIMLVLAWDATLRLDERVSPPRPRMSHAVELENELQTLTSVE